MKKKSKRDEYIEHHQLDFGFKPLIEKDRNHHLGGKSFYFFDFDDNVAYLPTPIIIYHKKTHKELILSSNEWSKHKKNIGKISSPYKDYYVNEEDCNIKGSFRYFGESPTGESEYFIEDIKALMKMENLSWQAPSWRFFYYATLNKRPVSLITARGHSIETVKAGIKLMVKYGHIPNIPNFLSIYPLSNRSIRKKLGDKEMKLSIPQLKANALTAAVETAIEVYGNNPHHRFGISEDDSDNIQSIIDEMIILKQRYPEMSFFVFKTTNHSYQPIEILINKISKSPEVENYYQIPLF